jgi:hypothetical protein
MFSCPVKEKWNDLVGLFIASISLLAPSLSRRASVMFGWEVLVAGAERTVGVELLLHAKRAATSIKPASIANTFIYGFTRFIVV